MSEKTWIIEAMRCQDEFDVDKRRWYTHDTFTDEAKANAEFDLQADLNGHNTYFRLYQIKRKLLREC